MDSKGVVVMGGRRIGIQLWCPSVSSASAGGIEANRQTGAAGRNRTDDTSLEERSFTTKLQPRNGGSVSSTPGRSSLGGMPVLGSNPSEVEGGSSFFRALAPEASPRGAWPVRAPPSLAGHPAASRGLRAPSARRLMAEGLRFRRPQIRRDSGARIGNASARPRESRPARTPRTPPAAAGRRPARRPRAHRAAAGAGRLVRCRSGGWTPGQGHGAVHRSRGSAAGLCVGSASVAVAATHVACRSRATADCAQDLAGGYDLGCGGVALRAHGARGTAVRAEQSLVIGRVARPSVRWRRTGVHHAVAASDLGHGIGGSSVGGVGQGAWE